MTLLDDCNLFLLKNEKNSFNMFAIHNLFIALNACSNGALRPDSRYNIITVITMQKQVPSKYSVFFIRKQA